MGRKRERDSNVPYSPGFRLRVVRTALEKKLSIDEVAELFGISPATWSYWKKAYKVGGEPVSLTGL